jgi:hypothetical protein
MSTTTHGAGVPEEILDAVVAVLGGAWLYWQLSAKRWFTGPHRTIDEPLTAAEAAALAEEREEIAAHRHEPPAAGQ